MDASHGNEQRTRLLANERYHRQFSERSVYCRGQEAGETTRAPLQAEICEGGPFWLGRSHVLAIQSGWDGRV